MILVTLWGLHLNVGPTYFEVFGQAGMKGKKSGKILLDKGQSTLVNSKSGMCYTQKFFLAESIPFLRRACGELGRDFRGTVLHPGDGLSRHFSYPPQFPARGVQILIYGAWLLCTAKGVGRGSGAR